MERADNVRPYIKSAERTAELTNTPKADILRSKGKEGVVCPLTEIYSSL